MEGIGLKRHVLHKVLEKLVEKENVMAAVGCGPREPTTAHDGLCLWLSQCHKALQATLALSCRLRVMLSTCGHLRLRFASPLHLGLAGRRLFRWLAFQKKLSKKERALFSALRDFEASAKRVLGRFRAGPSPECTLLRFDLASFVERSAGLRQAGSQ